MDCKASQGIIQGLHHASERKKIGETHRDHALQHLPSCTKCQLWFSQNVCTKMQNENDDDTRIIHGMAHEPLGSECLYL